MTADMPGAQCPSSLLADVLDVLGRDDAQGLERLDALLPDYDLDPRLHFLRGSVLAGLKRYEAAIAAIGRAVEIAPGFVVARFQLGFLHYTSGDAAAADRVWRPLADLPADSPPRLFAEGLGQLARDEIDAGVATLERGIALNTENPPMNADMRLLIDGVHEKLGGGEEEAVSSTHLLLQRYEGSGLKH